MAKDRGSIFKKLFEDAEIIQQKKSDILNNQNDGMFKPNLNQKSMQLVNGSRILGFKKENKKYESEAVDHYTVYNVTPDMVKGSLNGSAKKSNFGEYYYNTHQDRAEEVCLIRDYQKNSVKKRKTNLMYYYGC